jgi:MFS transporter, PPP family, 3-phenylpropionic acid transporter
MFGGPSRTHSGDLWLPNPRLLALRLYYFFSFAALGIHLPFLPPWLEARGVLGLGLGVTLAMLPAMGLIAPPAFGLIADVFGLRGYLLRIACGGAALAFAALALGPSLAGHPLGFTGLFLAILAFAFFRAPMIPMADVIAMEEAKSGSATYPRIRIWGSIGFLIAVVVAGRFLDPTHITALPYVVAALLFAAQLASIALPSRTATPPVPSPGHVRALLRSRDFPVFLGASFLSQAAHCCYDVCYSLHLRDLGVTGTGTGVAWGIGVVVELAIMAFSAPLFDRFTAPRLLTVAYAGASARWILIATLRHEGALFAVQLLHGASFALMWLASLAYIRDRVPPAILATAQGLFTATIAAGAALGILVWGPLYHHAGGGVAFLIAALLAALASALALVLVGRSGKARNQRQAPSVSPS